MLLNCGVGEDPRVPWTARRSHQSILKEISPECSLEGLMLKLKFQYFGHLMWRADSFEKTWCWERLRAGGEGDNRGWDHWMASLTRWTWVGEHEQALGIGDGQGIMVCCSPWACRVRHDWVTELRSQLFIFGFVFLAWGDRYKKILLRSMSKSILLMFSSRSFVVQVLYLHL